MQKLHVHYFKTQTLVAVVHLAASTALLWCNESGQGQQAQYLQIELLMKMHLLSCWQAN